MEGGGQTPTHAEEMSDADGDEELRKDKETGVEKTYAMVLVEQDDDTDRAAEAWEGMMGIGGADTPTTAAANQFAGLSVNQQAAETEFGEVLRQFKRDFDMNDSGVAKILGLPTGSIRSIKQWIDGGHKCGKAEIHMAILRDWAVEHGGYGVVAGDPRDMVALEDDDEGSDMDALEDDVAVDDEDSDMDVLEGDDTPQFAAGSMIDDEAVDSSVGGQKNITTSAVNRAQKRVDKAKEKAVVKLSEADAVASANVGVRDAVSRTAIATVAKAIKMNEQAAAAAEVNAEEVDYAIDEFEEEHAVHAALFESLQDIINPSVDEVVMTAAERDRRNHAANAYADYVRKLSTQQKALNERAYRLRAVAIAKEKQRGLKRKADEARKLMVNVKSAAAEQEETLAEPAKERKLSDRAKKRREARGMRAAGDPDAWWRYLPRDEDDDADAGAVPGGLKAEAEAEAEAAAAKDVRAQKMTEQPMYSELPTGVSLSDLFKIPGFQAFLREIKRGGEQEWEPASVSPEMVFEPEPGVESQASVGV